MVLFTTNDIERSPWITTPRILTDFDGIPDKTSHKNKISADKSLQEF